MIRVDRRLLDWTGVTMFVAALPPGGAGSHPVHSLPAARCISRMLSSQSGREERERRLALIRHTVLTK